LFVDFIPPALNGTLNVFKSIERNASVKKVVVTSSVASIAWNGGALPPDHVYTEADWSNAVLLREKGFWYPLSKTVAEQAAWDFVKKLQEANREIELTVVNPTLVLGPLLQNNINTSSAVIKDIIVRFFYFLQNVFFFYFSYF
jgi:nucleoside-diphosphate-sugar epimerase